MPKYLAKKFPNILTNIKVRITRLWFPSLIFDITILVQVENIIGSNVRDVLTLLLFGVDIDHIVFFGNRGAIFFSTSSQIREYNWPYVLILRYLFRSKMIIVI